MQRQALRQILKYTSTASEIEASVNYLTGKLVSIVKPNERVLIVFPNDDPSGIGAIMGRAVNRCNAVPLYLDGDLRWKNLLLTAFSNKVSTIVAPPLVVLGLTKIASHEGFPLYIYNTILAGYPSTDWMMDGIVQGLDCNIWGCFGPGAQSLITGFSCTGGRGVHLREDRFDFRVVDTGGNELPPGESGLLEIALKSDPEMHFLANISVKRQEAACTCGDPTGKIVDIDIPDRKESSILEISDSLTSWNSVLDCRIRRTECGLDLELVVFPGEKLPKLPACAKMVVRPWDPETDIPFSLSFGLEEMDFYCFGD